jgi:oxygen-independent coproporphyrinogen-3 oxidase
MASRAYENSMTLSGLFSGSGGAFETPRSLYIHIPLCSSRCAYCDFHSLPCAKVPAAQRAAYTEILLRRVETLCAAIQAPVETVYIGGGTPTALEDSDFRRIVGGIGAMFGHSLREWTVEANPESLSPTKLEIMVESGVTRLSIGIQSMDEGELELLRAMQLAAGSGLALSADLITALPVNKVDSKRSFAAHLPLRDGVGILAGKGFGHISIYDLVVEEGTAIHRRLDEGELIHVDEDRAFDERREAESFLDSLGYGRYEVSNYALPGRECVHNRAYWSMDSYLGIGSGAVSTLIVADGARADSLGASGALALRIEEGKNLASFLRDPDEDVALSWIDRQDSVFELVMMSLRCSDGLDEKRFRSRFGLEARDMLQSTIRKYGEHFSGIGGRLCLDNSGLDVLNMILVDAMDEMELSCLSGSHRALLPQE